jgi:hypothetical protein
VGKQVYRPGASGLRDLGHRTRSACFDRYSCPVSGRTGARFVALPRSSKWCPCIHYSVLNDSPDCKALVGAARLDQSLLESQGRKLDQVNRENEWVKTENERLKDKVIRHDNDRAMFRQLLIDAYEEGGKIYKNNPSQHAAEDWKERVSMLLEEAVGNELVERVLGHDPTFRSVHFGTTTEEIWMESRLNRLIDYAESLQTQETVQFRRGFDQHGREWQSRQ